MNLEEKWINGHYTNKYRFMEDYIEVKLQNDHIGKINIEDLPLFIQCTWNAKNGYMCHSKTKDFPQQKFHRLIYPEYSIIDHINRNGLDNRRKNLRDGSNCVNQNNMPISSTNTSGKTGVSFDKSCNRWRAYWEENGETKIKNFSVITYGEEAYKEAVKCRIEVDQRLGILNGYEQK